MACNFTTSKFIRTTSKLKHITQPINAKLFSFDVQMFFFSNIPPLDTMVDSNNSIIKADSLIELESCLEENYLQLQFKKCHI